MAVVAGADSGLIDTPRFSRRGDRKVAAVLFESRLLLKMMRDAMKALDMGVGDGFPQCRPPQRSVWCR